MSRVLLVSHEASRTGAPRIAALVARGLVEQGHRVRIVSQRPGPLVEDFAAVAPTRVTPLWRTLRRAWARPGRVRSRAAALLEVGTAIAVVAAHRPDLVYVNSTSSAAYVRAATLLRHPAVLHVHESGEVLRGFLGRVGIDGLPGGDVRLVACSPSVADALVGLGAASEDLDLLLSIPDATRLAGAAPQPTVPPRAVVVGCLGAVEHRKGVDLWLQVARSLLDSAPPGSLRFVWVGGGDPPAGAAGLAGVEFAGASADPAADMARFDIMTLPSRDDPFPLVVMEAMLLGKPVVAFDVGGVSHQLGDAGVLVPPEDVESFAREVAALVADAGRREELGARGRERAATLFSWESFEAGLGQVLAKAAR
ncbi:glycosyltransferase family 4 protein [Nocardioides renjunii]|uniref:glycosyltransferase family 4 protein n=1 Tax=Nocardioides renjunii TaxID=3095075 RepID=UPI002B000084|nr:glycosyltransferase family 4 protein [Nocardioides sp. S-34]WQQ21555.1 glycosyltransferase family 4 protein [Nocardioides sp. S-34]